MTQIYPFYIIIIIYSSNYHTVPLTCYRIIYINSCTVPSILHTYIYTHRHTHRDIPILQRKKLRYGASPQSIAQKGQSQDVSPVQDLDQCEMLLSLNVWESQRSRVACLTSHWYRNKYYKCGNSSTTFHRARLLKKPLIFPIQALPSFIKYYNPSKVQAKSVP